MKSGSVTSNKTMRKLFADNQASLASGNPYYCGSPIHTHVAHYASRGSPAHPLQQAYWYACQKYGFNTSRTRFLTTGDEGCECSVVITEAGLRMLVHADHSLAHEKSMLADKLDRTPRCDINGRCHLVGYSNVPLEVHDMLPSCSRQYFVCAGL